MCDCLMLKTPLRKMERSLLMPAIFITFNLTIALIMGLILYPVFAHPFLIWISMGILILSLIYWILASCKNPGVIKKPADVDYLELMSLIDPVQLCPDC